MTDNDDAHGNSDKLAALLSYQNKYREYSDGDDILANLDTEKSLEEINEILQAKAQNSDEDDVLSEKSIRSVILEKYTVPESPFKKEILELLESIYREIVWEGENTEKGIRMNDGLYLVGKYIGKTEYVRGEDSDYLNRLLANVQTAKREFQETCYASDITEKVIQRTKMKVVGMLLSQESSDH